MKKFNGDPLEWSNFKETFEAAIDENTRISKVQKFSYLINFLDGSALEAVKGFPVTNKSYDEAFDLLKSRYGNPQLIILSHMNNLIKLEKVSNSNVKELRKLFDRVESNVRALNTIGINSKHFGPLLIPIVLEKLPNVIRLQISRKLGKDNWNIDEFIKAINSEITARENYEFLKHDEHEENDRKKYEPKHALTSGINKKKCCFCKSEEHYSDKCEIIADVQARRDILKKERYCFNCLKPGHAKKDCRIKIKCYKCKSLGSHHTALCEFKDSATNLVTQDTTILLQTADAKIINKKKNCHYVAKVLFDSCSQQTYIAEKVVKKLNLAPVREINIGIKPFNSDREKVMKLKEYDLCLNSCYNNSDIYIRALALPNICLPVGGQFIDVAVTQNPSLQSINLADRGISHNKEIDLLIGADFYWQLVNGETKRIKDVGLVAINSNLGWLLNGPVPKHNNIVNNNVNLVQSSHVLKVSCELKNEELFTQNLQKFWDLDTIGIKENEKSVYENVSDEIKLDGNRYTVKLPFR